jgi:hypothetical protein
MTREENILISPVQQRQQQQHKVTICFQHFFSSILLNGKKNPFRDDLK